MYKLFFETLFYTELRLGECLALNWNDLKGNYIVVNKTLTKNINPLSTTTVEKRISIVN